jgi:hypothetical protein
VSGALYPSEQCIVSLYAVPCRLCLTMCNAPPVVCLVSRHV